MFGGDATATERYARATEEAAELARLCAARRREAVAA
jgi:hypothetical protein